MIATMKNTYIHICLAAFVATGAMTLSSCSQDDLLAKADEENAALTTTNENDTFTATFIPAMYEPMSRAAVDGTSSAVQSLKYLIYKDNGNGQYMYYDEKELFGFGADVNAATQESHQWPYSAITVDLPGGNYKVAFVANTNPKLFGEDCNELLSYSKEGSWEEVRLNMPESKNNKENKFKSNNMFYMDAVKISSAEPVAEVCLERKVNKVQLWRETVSSDNGRILTLLLTNVLDDLSSEDPVTGLVGGPLGEALYPILHTLVGGLEGVLLEPILNGVVKALKPIVVEALVEHILDPTVEMNDQLALLQGLTNPWALENADASFISLGKMPKSMDLDGIVTDYYEDVIYSCGLEEDGNMRYMEFIGLADGASSEWNIKRVDIAKQGLVGGLVIDEVVEGLILPESLIDAGGELSFNNQMTNEAVGHSFGPNYQYYSIYSVAALNVDNSAYKEVDENEGLTVTVDLAKVANLESLLGPVLGGVLGQALGLDKIIEALVAQPITITLPFNLGVLNTNNLEVTGNWGEIHEGTYLDDDKLSK